MPDFLFDDDDDGPNPFDELADTLNDLQRQRAARAAQDRIVDDLRFNRPAPRPYLSAVEITGLAKSLRAKFDPDGELQRVHREMLATEERLQKADRAREEAARERRYAARVERHRELVRQQIPQLLSKALEIQQRGGCTALDVAKVQAECIHLAERWL